MTINECIIKYTKEVNDLQEQLDRFNRQWATKEVTQAYIMTINIYKDFLVDLREIQKLYKMELLPLQDKIKSIFTVLDLV